MEQVPSIGNLEASWLARRLGLEGAFEMTDEPVGSGQVANCHRFVLSSSDGARHRVIAKYPSRDATSRSTAALQRLYYRETSFYRELAAKVATRTPACYFVAHGADDNFLLLLEDMSPSRVVDQFDGLDVATAKNALRQLARLHGPTAADAALHRAPWLGGTADALRPLYGSILPDLFRGFLDRYVDDLDDATAGFIAHLGEHLASFSDYEAYVSCVTHGDFRTDNLLLDAQNARVPVCVVDWQTVGVASPLLDVAYFLTTSLTTSDREAHEEELLGFYLDELARFEVELPPTVARAEFARYTLQPVVMLVAAAVLVERTERGDRMFLSMIERGVRAATSWNAFDELERRAVT